MATPRRRADPVEVVAHRGASADESEHTMAAYGHAIRLGADAVECDVRMTRDGVLVRVHDRRIDRTSTGGRLSIAPSSGRRPVSGFGAALPTVPLQIRQVQRQGRPTARSTTIQSPLRSPGGSPPASP